MIPLDGCIREDEKLDELFNGRIRIIQKIKGYRFSLDAVLLAHFAAQQPASSIIDLGTGSGIVPLIVARKRTSARITGVELQRGLADMARRSIRLNGLSERVAIVHADLRTLADMFKPGSFELVVSNPPYFPLDNGRINPQEEKAIARHELKTSLHDVIEVSAYLSAASGSVLLILPAKRLIESISLFKTRGLKVSSIRFFHSRPAGEAKLVLMEGRKEGNPELEITEPFFIYGEDGTYSPEMKAIYAGL